MTNDQLLIASFQSQLQLAVFGIKQQIINDQMTMNDRLLEARSCLSDGKQGCH